jgi:hypothetical protein
METKGNFIGLAYIIILLSIVKHCEEVSKSKSKGDFSNSNKKGETSRLGFSSVDS